MTESTQPSPIEARQAEVNQYQQNIILFTAILQTLPTEWPEHLIAYRAIKDKHTSIAEIESLNDVELLSKLWYADECRAAIRSETVEMTKSAAILSFLKSQV